MARICVTLSNATGHWTGECMVMGLGQNPFTCQFHILRGLHICAGGAIITAANVWVNVVCVLLNGGYMVSRGVAQGIRSEAYMEGVQIHKGSQGRDGDGPKALQGCAKF